MLKSFLLIILMLGSACQSSSESALLALQRSNSIAIFNDSVTEFKISVFYEVGATPYTGPIGLSGNDTWDITKTSYTDLFQNRPGRTITVPSTTAQMTQIPDQAKTTWNSSDLISLANQYAPKLSIGTQINVAVFFLNGEFEGNADILGVQLSGYPFAFIFKDVVIGVGGNGASQRYVEQSTVVHEVGHVVGLVNNGIPMVTSHEDLSHPHHANNTNCVMYWANESQSNILSALTNVIIANQLSLFGPESKQDAQAYHP